MIYVVVKCTVNQNGEIGSKEIKVLCAKSCEIEEAWSWMEAARSRDLFKKMTWRIVGIVEEPTEIGDVVGKSP